MGLERHILNGEAKQELDKLGELINNSIDKCDEIIYRFDGQTVPTETITSALLFRKAIEKADAIFVTIEQGAEHAAQSILRDLFENTVCLAYLIQGDTERRAKCYYVGWLRSKKDILERLLPTTDIGRVVVDFLGDDSSIDHDQVEEELRRVKVKLNSSWMQGINRKWNDLERHRQGKVNWFSLYNGPRSIRKLATKVDMQAEYDLLYFMYSLETHSLNAIKSLEHIDGEGFLRPIRTYENPATILRMAQNYLWKSALLIVSRFYPENLPAFRHEFAQLAILMRSEQGRSNR
ncbi:DUF5677 domain-containing protein [Paenibacillus montanisoli]|uniref:Uncharacterized protein n=1 Tax=Paenibacillus montanisoli TaxID=2081970 RepID=A0A328TV29_9BACL|nr:DUF5677 domain-containing protein [Paenibacillus montanisoli]RAP74389.1 hypothetical protein DL346_20115 [Paenibacillus montanisoli]